MSDACITPARYNPIMKPAQTRARLGPYSGPGLFVTGTGTDVGKTIVMASLAAAFRRLHLRVGILKPIASGCPKMPHRGNDPSKVSHEDLLSPDVILAAGAAGLDPSDEVLMRYMSPLRYAVPAAPVVAARVEGRPIDWQRVETALDWWQENCEVLLVEGAGGWYVPIDEDDFMMGDLAAALRLPVVVVTFAGLGAINATLLTVHAIQERSLPVAGLVFNRVPGVEMRDLATETNLVEIPRLSGVPLRAALPDLGQDRITSAVPEDFVEAMMPFAQEWWSHAQRQNL